MNGDLNYIHCGFLLFVYRFNGACLFDVVVDQLVFKDYPK